ncbi:MAG: FAD-dependent oxidoreductase, partial [Parahaliea sp.]
MRNIVIAGAGFAGMWSALSAARAVALAGKENAVAITVVSPRPRLEIRPRFYEQAFDEMAPDIGPLFAAVGVRHLAGTVEAVRSAEHEVDVRSIDGTVSTLPYDRFILATGSQLYLPDVPGLREHSFNVDQLASARELDTHL